MACCFLCFPDDPIDGVERKDNPYTFHTSMMNACCANPCCCLATLACPHVSACYIRYKALDDRMEDYRCCQGYHPCLCIQPGQMGEQSCPWLCLTLESCCFLTCAVTGTRYHLMDKYGIQPDPSDYQIIRFNNCLQFCSCICDILACFFEDLREGARELRHLAHIIFCTTQSCMQVQSYEEARFQKSKGMTAPTAVVMESRF